MDTVRVGGYFGVCDQRGQAFSGRDDTDQTHNTKGPGGTRNRKKKKKKRPSAAKHKRAF